MWIFFSLPDSLQSGYSSGRAAAASWTLHVWSWAMTRCRRRKCRNCRQMYEPDPRNVRHQRYCSQPACRRASKAASQRRWLSSPKGRGYFRGPTNVQRVQAWRRVHPGYWKPAPKPPTALQDHSLTQPPVNKADTITLTGPALQDHMLTQTLAVAWTYRQLNRISVTRRHGRHHPPSHRVGENSLGHRVGLRGRREEREAAVEFGDAYLEYMRRTKRFVPFVV